MRILVMEPKGIPKVMEIADTLQAMQKIVGGMIQVLYPFEDEVALICNDEGKLLGLSLNRELRTKDGICYDILCGTFFIVGAPVDCDHFTSLTEEQLQRYSEVFAVPRKFLSVGGRIVILPYKEETEEIENESESICP